MTLRTLEKGIAKMEGYFKLFDLAPLVDSLFVPRDLLKEKVPYRSATAGKSDGGSAAQSSKSSSSSSSSRNARTAGGGAGDGGGGAGMGGSSGGGGSGGGGDRNGDDGDDGEDDRDQVSVFFFFADPSDFVSHVKDSLITIFPEQPCVSVCC